VSTVQVIIPCYNYARYLPACVASVLSQEGVDVSVLIIDDCSSDNSAEVCSELANADKRVSFIHHKVNKGHIATYNEGLQLASSDYLVLLSADDLLTPGALRRAADLMDKNPSVGLVYGHAITFRDQMPSSVRTKSSGYTVWNGAEWIEMMCRSGRNFIVCPEVVMRTSIQHRIGGYTAELPHSGDMEMWLRAAALSDVGYLKGVDQAYYRAHPLSMQRTIHAGLLFDLNGRLEAFKSAFSKEAGQLSDAERLFATARRALSRTAIRHALESIKCGAKLDVPVDAYENFAKDIDPNVTATREWRELRRARDRSQGHVGAFLARQTADLRGRIVWRLWRHFGFHHFIQ
jgi:glycosyltransferase involved in cell wall biosynthesis